MTETTYCEATPTGRATPIFRVSNLGSILWIVLSATTVAETSHAAGRVPHLIARHSPQLRAAWQDVDQLLEENSRLAVPLPDPYFARGDLWAVAGAHEDALADYVAGTRLLLKSRPNLLDQSRALQRVAQGLNRLIRQPKPDYPLESEQSFQLGLNSYYRGDVVTAREFFAEATRMNPGEPGYRALHALALRRIGRDVDAERQLIALRAVLWRGDDVDQQRRTLYWRLARIQGPERRWLEQRLVAPGNQETTLEQEARVILARNGVASPGG